MPKTYSLDIHRIYKGLAAAIIVGSFVVAPAFSEKPVLKVGIEDTSVYDDATVIDAPLPELPSDLHEHCFKSCCIARFVIKPDGKHSVTLLTSTGSTDVDDIALKTLNRWKFKPAMLNGKPVQSTRKVKVEFEVE